MTPRDDAVVQLRLAALSGLYDGRIRTAGEAAYIRRCTVTLWQGATYIRLIYTRDVGHHSSGWWKNPDFERCLHLSVSFAYPDGSPARFEFDAAQAWARAMFGHDTRWVWVEPAYSPEGKGRDVHHYRLFCDQGWNPIKPRREVYSREFTESGWRSFSEIHGEAEAALCDPPIGPA
jgi:hypothetical protein